MELESTEIERITIMGPGIFLIAIMGCADGGSQCTKIDTLPARYETHSACVAATSAALETNNRYDYPTLVAQCQEAPGAANARNERRTGRRITDRGRSG